jgi:hypothetical protein
VKRVTLTFESLRAEGARINLVVGVFMEVWVAYTLWL